jgi:exonuclease III
MLSWNIRGMNNTARKENLKQVVTSIRPDLICIQETKMAVINDATIRNSLGREHENSYVFKPVDVTRGGILIASKESTLQLQSPSITEHIISASVLDTRINTIWMIIGVYGPQGELEKKMFIRELRHLKDSALPSWLIIGDFNIIYKDEDKNNGRLNRRLMLRFRWALNHLEMKEIHLIGRKYTWTNS